MSSSTITLDYVNSVVPDSGFFAVKATSSLSTPQLTANPLASISYILFSGENVDSLSEGEFTNGNIPGQALLQNGSSFIMYVPNRKITPLADYYIVASATFSDGTSTPYSSQALQLYLPPASPVLASDAAVMMFDSSSNITNIVVQLPSDYDATTEFVAALQYVDASNSSLQFVTQEVNSVTGQIELSVEGSLVSAYIALQPFISHSETYKSYGELSNTENIEDNTTPLPPTDLSANYTYSNQQVVLTWGASPYAWFLNPTYNVYKKVNSGSFVLLENVGSALTYTDSVSGNVGDIVSYQVKAVVDSVESDPSNTVSVTVFAPSTAPLDLQAVASYDASNNLFDGHFSWKNPTEVSGSTDGAFFTLVLNDGESDVYTNTDVLYDASANDYELDISTNLLDENVIYTVTCFLTTLEDEEPVAGASATTTVVASSRPFVYDPSFNITGGDVRLTGFSVLTWTLLVKNTIVTSLRSEIDYIRTYNNLDVTQSISEETRYPEYLGAYKYRFTNLDIIVSNNPTDPPESYEFAAIAANASLMGTYPRLDSA
jgi:hypothetical protein